MNQEKFVISDGFVNKIVISEGSELVKTQWTRN